MTQTQPNKDDNITTFLFILLFGDDTEEEIETDTVDEDPTTNSDEPAVDIGLFCN